ncbi:centrosomal protein of 78 kDa-like isoform X3 [Rhodnius prolixus]
MLEKVVEAFAACITVSKTLMCLEFQSIPLQYEAMNILSEALSKTNCLQHLVLQHCNIGDEGCKLISKALRNQPTVQTIDLSNCEITEQGAFYIAELIKVQEIARFGECWKHSLRYREVSHEIISGLRRIILNNNPNIGDKGLQSIVLVLCDDFWIRALDMQNCGITDLGCTAIINLISMNNKIVVFDIRKNPIQDQNKVTEIFHLLFSHSSPCERAEYGWLKIEPSSSSSSSNVSMISTLTYGSRRHKLPFQAKSLKSVGINKSIARAKSENINLCKTKSSPGRISTASKNSVATWQQFSREKIEFEKSANATEYPYYNRFLEIEKLKG